MGASKQWCFLEILLRTRALTMLIKYYYTSSRDKTTPVCHRQGRSQEFLCGIQNSTRNFPPRLKYETTGSTAVGAAYPLPTTSELSYWISENLTGTVRGPDPWTPSSPWPAAPLVTSGGIFRILDRSHPFWKSFMFIDWTWLLNINMNAIAPWRVP